MRLLLVALLALTSCSGGSGSFNPPPLTYEDRVPIPLDVSEVRIENRYRSPEGPPNIERSLPVTPEAATFALLEQRLHAAGIRGGALALIDDASVVEEVVGGFGEPEGRPKEDSQTRLRGRIKVRVLELNNAGATSGSLTTAVTRTVSIPRDADFSERQAIGYALVRTLVDDFDRGLVESIYGNFAVVPREARPRDQVFGAPGP